MKHLFTILILAISLSTFAQEKGKLEGRVIDQENLGEPLIFAQISLKNTNIQAETDFRGNFTMNQLNPGAYTLVINYAGYDTKEVPLLIKKNKITTIFEALENKRMDVDQFSEFRKDIKVVTSTEIPGQ